MQASARVRGQSWDLAAIFLLGAVFRVALLLVFPEPYGEDGFGRIYFRDRIFLSHWLPLAQSIVYLTGLLSRGVFPIRLVFALLGALAACGVYLFLRRIVDRRAALAGGLIFSLNSLAVTLSLMPYQDILFLGLYYLALSELLFEARGGGTQEGILRSRTGGFFFGLACLTRYEAWFVLPVLTVWKALREARPFSPSEAARSALRSTLFFGWAPAAWFLMSYLRWRGWNEFLFRTPDRQFYGWHPHFDLAWAAGYLYQWLVWTVRFGSPPVAALAVYGAIRLGRRKQPLGPALRLLFVNGVLVSLFFFFVIGKEQETVFRFVTFPLSIVLVVATIGLEDLMRRFEGLGPRLRLALAGTALAALALYAAVGVARVTAEPRHRDPYAIARFLEASLARDERVLVSADRSRELEDDAPLLYQRIVAQVRFDRSAIEAAGNMEWTSRAEFFDGARRRRVRYLVVFDNFRPWRPVDVWVRDLVEAKPEWLKEVFRAQQARVYRVLEWPSP